MNVNSRDIRILKNISKYCLEAEAAIHLFGDSVEILRVNSIYKNATAMCILQIGELVGHLSEGMLEKYNEMPWKQIRAMRNIAAHGYADFDIDILWQTLKVDLPALYEYCLKIVSIENI
ncbi:MAG: DUF86 domain-containing protein [Eubacteriaceae bacterium]|nr:DUF86 domain-containing protein [Eubacteriaceae bacterium]